MKLSGRVALVTGGAHRLGREIALGLARAGADVAISYHAAAAAAAQTRSDLAALGRRAAAVRCDVRVPDEVERLAREVGTQLGPIDVLVVNAAVFFPTPLERMTEDDWEQHFEVNARGAFRCARQVGLQMRDRGGGSIVFIADVAGLRPWPGYIPYSASKAAVIAVTKGLAVALAPGVRVNAVAPGPVLPPEDYDAEAIRKTAATTVLGRTGSPADVADAVVYLATAEYVTGAILPVDGGRHLR